MKRDNCLMCQEPAGNKFCSRKCYYVHKKANEYPGVFKKGHPNVAGFKVGHKHSPESIAKISGSLVGKFGVSARRWKGEKAGYVAKHMWIHKHYGKALYCENDNTHNSSRFEWANLSGKYLRARSDYKSLCKRCHVNLDRKPFCRNGHLKEGKNLYVNPKTGWRSCQICLNVGKRKYAAKIQIQSLG